MVVTARARIIWIIGEECLDELMDMVLLPGPDTYLVEVYDIHHDTTERGPTHNELNIATIEPTTPVHAT